MLNINTWRLQEILRYRRRGRMLAVIFSPLGGWFVPHPLHHPLSRMSLTMKDSANAP